MELDFCSPCTSFLICLAAKNGLLEHHITHSLGYDQCTSMPWLFMRFWNRQRTHKLCCINFFMHCPWKNCLFLCRKYSFPGKSWMLFFLRPISLEVVVAGDRTRIGKREMNKGEGKKGKGKKEKEERKKKSRRSSAENRINRTTEKKKGPERCFREIQRILRGRAISPTMHA